MSILVCVHATCRTAGVKSRKRVKGGWDKGRSKDEQPRRVIVTWWNYVKAMTWSRSRAGTHRTPGDLKIRWYVEDLGEGGKTGNLQSVKEVGHRALNWRAERKEFSSMLDQPGLPRLVPAPPTRGSNGEDWGNGSATKGRRRRFTFAREAGSSKRNGAPGIIKERKIERRASRDGPT